MDSLTDSKKAWRCAWPCLASVERFNSFVYDHSENHATAFLTWTRRQLFGTSSASYRPLAPNFDSFLYSPIVTIQRQDCTDDWNVSAVYSAVVHWLNRDSTQIVSLITHLSDIAYLVSRHIFEYYIFLSVSESLQRSATAGWTRLVSIAHKHTDAPDSDMEILSVRLSVCQSEQNLWK